MLLTAGHDTSALQFPLELKLSSGKEMFQSISGKSVSTVKGDLMVCSGSKILSAILRGPDYHTRITKDTKAILFTVYAPQDIDNATVSMMLKMLENRVQAISPDSETMHLQVYESEVNLSPV